MLTDNMTKEQAARATALEIAIHYREARDTPARVIYMAERISEWILSGTYKGAPEVDPLDE